MISVSAVCVTFGRTARLNEALQCFIDQSYPGPHELVVLNTCPQQVLAGTFPNVKLINLTQRPKSLGDARNKAILHAIGDVIVMCDDDDFYLPHHLQVFAEAFEQSKADWVRVSEAFYAEKWKILGTTKTWINSVAFKRGAWKKAGGYREDLSVGEDRDFFSRLSQQCQGAEVALAPEGITAIYCWNNGVHHLSGLGDDQLGQMPAYERARIDLADRIRREAEPKGQVKLQPGYEHNPVAMVKEYADKQDRVKKNSVCLVELGRYGDIINILPIALHIHNNYGTPYLMVAKEFADLLASVSYVKPFVTDLRNDQIREALAVAEKKFDCVVNCQIWGGGNFGAEIPHLTQSFNHESWRIAGFGTKFLNVEPQWKPCFDLRDRTRELALWNKLDVTGKPVILVNVSRSISSPFSAGPALLAHLREHYGEKYQVIDVADLRLPNFVDLLGFIDRARAVVSVDTSLLHLAAASNTPVLAIVNSIPWLGSQPRCRNAVVKYDKAAADFDCVWQKLDLILSWPRNSIVYLPPLKLPPERRILHCVERHNGSDGQDEARKAVAWKSWDTLYEHGVVPCHYWNYSRTAMQIGDKRLLPFLKDVLRFGMDQASDDDIIMWTNDDSILHPDLPDMVLAHCAIWGAVTSQRCEFKGCAIANQTQPASEYAARGRTHMGRDLFAATKRWLLDHWDEMGDPILGAPAFDLMLAAIVRLDVLGAETTRENLEWVMFPADMKRGYVSHQHHEADWTKPHMTHSPAQKWNHALFQGWASKKLPNLKFDANNVI